MSIFATLGMLLVAAPGAFAAETIFWDNFAGSPDSIGHANPDGSGGTELNVSGAEVADPEGMTIDSAGGRLFWSNDESEPAKPGAIFFANLNGSGGGGKLNTSGVEVHDPLGVAINPGTGIIYWANDAGGAAGKGSIAFARLDGSGGGQLDTTGGAVLQPGPVAIDTSANRIYWGNYENNTISFASLSGGGGGTLDLTGATPPTSITGLAIDPTSGRIYWDNNTAGGTISFASLSGGSGGDLNISGATFNSPFGTALDPVTGRVYWGNYGNHEERAGAIAFAATNGSGGTSLNITAGPVAGPQDPVILRSPSGTGAPQVTRVGALLSCTQGNWAADAAGSFYYQAPQSYAYQWTLNGSPIAGATSNSYTATAPGAYACTVTASNAEGSAAQTSAAVPVKAAKLALSIKPHKASARAGKAASFRVKVRNSGDLASSHVRLCVKAAKKAKRAVKVPKCRSLVVAAHKSVSKTVKVKLAPNATGSYKLTFSLRGKGASKPAKVTLSVK